MKLFKKLRKGFTLIELVVVIAVIAVLAAVSVVSYIAITNNAKKSKDQQLVDQVNLSLQAAEISKAPKTMHEALEIVEEDGYKPAKFKAEYKEHEFAYNLTKNRFVLFKDGTVTYPKDMGPESGKNYQIWRFADAAGEFKDGFSHYLRKGASGTVTADAGVDVGSNTGISTISYSADTSKDVVIRTNGGVLNIGSSTKTALGQIYHYGVTRESTVYTEMNCFHARGAIGSLNLKAGKAIAEEDSLVYLSTATVGSQISEQDNGKFFIPEGTTQAEDGTGVPASVAAQVGIVPVEVNPSYTYEDATKTGGNVYGIGSLSALEQFRDLVNSGFSFDGITVKLTDNITLNDGWTPIGEGSRKAAINTSYTSPEWDYSGNVYKGEFDGNNKKIYNLNNKGYEPTASCLGKDDKGPIYCYGFFSLVAGNAYIHDLELVNVDIDTARYSTEKAMGDCVGALVGFSAGSLHLDNIKVSGSSTIIGYSAVSSIVGKCYNQDKKVFDSEHLPTVLLENCESNAVVSVSTSHYAAGLFGQVANDAGKYESVTINGNKFTGEVRTLKNSSISNNAGIAILNLDGFTHSGNINTGRQIYGSSQTEMTKDLFKKMSQTTVFAYED